MNTPSIQVCIIGATGQVGTALLHEFSAMPEIASIEALTRRPLTELLPKVVNTVIDFKTLAAAPLKTTPTVFISALGTTIKSAGTQAAFREVDYDYNLAFGKLAEKTGAKKLQLVSALGADPHSRVFYNRTKGELERDLAILRIPSIEFYRPSLLLGPREEVRIAELVGKGLMSIANPLFLGPLRKYRGIHATAVAHSIATHASLGTTGIRIFESDEI